MAKAIEHQIYGIKCDAPGCGYEDDSVRYEDYSKFLNAPCPQCGAPLLTQADLDATNRIMEMAEKINNLVGDIPDGSVPMLRMSVEMNGTGKVDCAVKEVIMPKDQKSNG